MKRVGVLLTAGPGGGTYQYTQTILDAALTLPRDRYTLAAAYVEPLWLGELAEDVTRPRHQHPGLDRRAVRPMGLPKS